MRGGVEEGKYNRRHYFLLKLYRMLAWRARKFAVVIVTTCHYNNPLLLDAIYALTAARALLRGWIYSLERLVSVSLVAIIGYERLFVALSKDRRISERERYKNFNFHDSLISVASSQSSSWSFHYFPLLQRREIDNLRMLRCLIIFFFKCFALLNIHTLFKYKDFLDFATFI